MDVEGLVALEHVVWQAMVAGAAAADAIMLSHDFVGVSPAGFADRDEHASQLNDGPTVASYELLDARMIAISEDAAMLTYRAEYRRAGAAEPEVESMFVSSLWCRRGQVWTNVFSQDTPPGPALV